jgi:hypothetical protein
MDRLDSRIAIVFLPGDILKLTKFGFVFIGSAIDTVIVEVIPMMGIVFAMIVKLSRRQEVIYPKYEDGHSVGFLSYAVRKLRRGVNISRTNPDESTSATAITVTRKKRG